MEIKINNQPAEASKYEFVVARKCDGEWWYWGAYKNGFRATDAAAEIGGVVFHNCRINGYKED